MTCSYYEHCGNKDCIVCRPEAMTNPPKRGCYDKCNDPTPIKSGKIIYECTDCPCHNISKNAICSIHGDTGKPFVSRMPCDWCNRNQHPITWEQRFDEKFLRGRQENFSVAAHQLHLKDFIRTELVKAGDSGIGRGKSLATEYIQSLLEAHPADGGPEGRFNHSDWIEWIERALGAARKDTSPNTK